MLLVGLLAAQALQVWRNAEVVAGKPLQVKLPFLTTPGLGSVLNILQILFSLCRCPPVHHTASSVHSLRGSVNSGFLTLHEPYMTLLELNVKYV